jgi:hypothetical protein
MLGSSPVKAAYQRKTPPSLKRMLGGAVLELEIAIPQVSIGLAEGQKVQRSPDPIAGSTATHGY